MVITKREFAYWLYFGLMCGRSQVQTLLEVK